MSDAAEAEMTTIADEQPDLPIGMGASQFLEESKSEGT